MRCRNTQRLLDAMPNLVDAIRAEAAAISSARAARYRELQTKRNALINSREQIGDEMERCERELKRLLGRRA